MQDVVLKGITTIFHGTNNVGPTEVAGICPRATFKNAPNTGVINRIENNNGGEVITVLLYDGFDVDLEYVYDSAITWPALGDVVTVKSPTDGAGKSCLVVNSPVEECIAERKKEAMITVKCEYRPDRDLAGGDAEPPTP